MADAVLTGKTHLLFGFALLLGADAVGAIPFGPITMIGALLGALLPDVDHPESILGQRIRPASDMLMLLLGHRGFTHSAIACTMGGYLFYASYGNAALAPLLALLLGYFSHLLADWMTPSGIQLLWPNKKFFHAPFPIKTGGIGEAIFFVGLLGVSWWLLSGSEIERFPAFQP